MMKAEWFYEEDRQKRGPVALDEIRRRLRLGLLAPQQLVWRPGMSDWSPAARTGELADDLPAVAPLATAALPVQPAAGAIAPVAAIGYQGSIVDDIPCPPGALDRLRRTRKWLWLVFALVLLGAGGTSVLLGLAFVQMLRSLRYMNEYWPIVLVGVMLFGMLLYFGAAWHLGKYAVRITRLLQNRRGHELELVLSAQHAFWRYFAVVSILVIGGYTLFVSMMILQNWL